MFLRSFAACLLVTVLIFSPVSEGSLKASEAGCPSFGQGSDGVTLAVERAPTCQRAFEIMGQCSTAGGSDGPVGNAVQDKCERQFLPRLSRTQRRAYERQSQRCIDRYAHQAGSLYGSRIAFCRARLAVERAARYERQR